jgi:hypothetical protein
MSRQYCCNDSTCPECMQVEIQFYWERLVDVWRQIGDAVLITWATGSIQPNASIEWTIVERPYSGVGR